MLPDYFETKATIGQFFNRFFRSRMEHHLVSLGGFGEIPEHTIHEGEEFSSSNNAGDEDVTRMEKIGTSQSIPHSDTPHLELNVILEMLDNMAEDLARKKAKMIIEKLSESAEESGNIIEQRGKLGPDTLLDALEKIEVPFDEDGKPERIQLHLSPSVCPTSEQLEEWSNDPIRKKRYEEIISKKRREWNARENNRKLVG